MQVIVLKPKLITVSLPYLFFQQLSMHWVLPGKSNLILK